MFERSQGWVVLKFGGTSVSSASNWRNIVGVVRERSAAGLHPVIVHSALSGVTDRLEALLVAATAGKTVELLAALDRNHRQLAHELEIEPGATYERFFEDLTRLLAEVSDRAIVTHRARARAMAAGELLATALGAEFLNAQGVAASWVDAREVLRSEPRTGSNEQAAFLSATCDFAPDARLQSAWRALDRVIITQGFIASNPDGDTVLLGRGGSDTSGAYFAAKLAAQRLEIWTDVPGLFSANPRAVPLARLLRALHYDEAQEIASNGAKVLHPRCVLPARQYRIPVHVYATQAPGLEGTVISANVASSAARLKAIALRKGITLISMDSPGMWHQVGFLADAFQVFKQHGMSVDLISTSETNVTVSLDPSANTLDPAALERLTEALSALCRVEVLGPCASVSLLGQNIRAILHELGPAFELFQDHKVYLVSQAANDLNFTFVVDESQGERLMQQLHERLIESVDSDEVLGPTWRQLFAPEASAAAAPRPWWEDPARRRRLIEIATAESAAFVYDLPTVDAALAALARVGSVSRWAYAMKANAHPAILKRVHEAGWLIECVSQGELEHAFESLPGLAPERVLFTPNFARRSEYEYGLRRGVRVTLDNLYPLQAWPELFRGSDVILRIDPGLGRGHHAHVRTAGTHSKFGVPLADADELAELTARADAHVVGLHAHTGSGIFDVANWIETGELLATLAGRFPGVRFLDLGGGIGVPEQPGQHGVDLKALEAGVAQLKRRFAHLEFWMEPGRFVVAHAGVLVALVTQLKDKGGEHYVGITTGMNSLIRPALYGAHHEIRNLTRLDEPASARVTVVGPICESADVLGADRWMAPPAEGDVLLIANCGAYGHVMASHYNRRRPAAEFIIEN